MNCLENINVSSCIWFDGGDRKNAIAAMVSSILFFSGWWIIIDVASVYPTDLPKASHLCGVFATLSMIMINSVSNAQIRGETYTGGCMGPRGARLWLFLGFVMGFASLIAACWILFADYTHSGVHKWPGIGLFLQNALIFAGSLVFKFGRSEDLWV